MPEQVFDILSSDYFWGTIVGLLLSFIGAYALGHIQSRQLRTEWTNNFITLSADIIRNIMSATDDLADARRRSSAIHRDLLALIDAEIAIFGRNREYSIRISPDLRGELRKYINQIAIIRTRILGNLNQWEILYNQAREIIPESIDTTATSTENGAQYYLNQANIATDDLISSARDGKDLIQRLEKESTRRAS